MSRVCYNFKQSGICNVFNVKLQNLAQNNHGYDLVTLKSHVRILL